MMRRIATIPRGVAAALFLPLISIHASAQTHAESRASSRPVHTFSIVARDPATGELGVAVQSHWFAVGTLVPWVEAGVGAVAPVNMGRVEDSLPLFRRAFAIDGNWRTLTPRLAKVGLLPDDAKLIERIVGAGARD